MLSNCIKNLLNLKDVNIKSIKNLENSVEVYAELPLNSSIQRTRGNLVLVTER